MFSASLPDLNALDLEAVKALLIDRHESYTATLNSRTSEIERLVLLVEKLQRMLFGAKSEKVLRQIDQLELQLEELQAASAIEESKAVAPAERPAPAKPFRRPLPEHLPREVHTHMPGHEACPDCGGRLRELGEDVAEMLEYVRASLKVLRHVRPKLSCDACDRIVQAPAPSRPIDRGLAGPGLLAHVLVSKYADHCPVYRQSEIYAREGVDLDRSTLAGWVGATSELLAPLVEAVRVHVMAASKLHADDTPVPVLAPGNGRTKAGRLWTYVRDDRPSGDQTAPAVWFAYSPDRKGENPRQHLKLYKGALQADAYAGFQQLYESGTIVEVACWAHTRREFHEIHIAHASPITSEAIERIAALYAIEAEIRGSTPEIRKAIRQARARPLLDGMKTWLEATLAKLSRKSDTAAAIRYALSRWPALTRFTDDGQLEIDNNAAERALRVVALGRKNYLFAGSNAGGERAAAIYSLLGSAKLNGLDPELYLHHVLDRIADHPISRINDLLPWNVALPSQTSPA
ncbi:transposase [Granulicella aggregans]|uniref:Transposase n=1 Tax=Granulicella aggregans TaxID=474949 RepID=A0A7W7ZEZ5_9BACT|nr:IS66 family transposase [Granulicella aggregans]MBB5058136.1 transposase [Granulicella aggregans]